METVKTPSKKSQWTGRIISIICVLFLLFDSITKIIKLPLVVKATEDLGYPESTVVAIGIILLACVVLYIIPSTAILGAILLTGYLGGAIATHVRVENPLFSHTLFPVYFGVLIWLGLFLRDTRVKTLIINS